MVTRTLTHESEGFVVKQTQKLVAEVSVVTQTQRLEAEVFVVKTNPET